MNFARGLGMFSKAGGKEMGFSPGWMFAFDSLGLGSALDGGLRYGVGLATN